jgi:hypothetical protein
MLASSIRLLYNENANTCSIKEEELHMNYKEKILQLLNEIQDEEMLEFIYEIIIRLLN